MSCNVKRCRREEEVKYFDEWLCEEHWLIKSEENNQVFTRGDDR